MNLLWRRRNEKFNDVSNLGIVSLISILIRPKYQINQITNYLFIAVPKEFPIFTRVSKLVEELSNRSLSNCILFGSNAKTMVDPPNLKYPCSSMRDTLRPGSDVMMMEPTSIAPIQTYATFPCRSESMIVTVRMFSVYTSTVVLTAIGFTVK